MTYPKTNPKIKHDLMTLSAELETFTSSTQIFEKTDDALRNASQLHPKRLSSVYSYDDGPDYPGPLSRGLLILGFANRDLAVVKTVLGGQQGGGSGRVPDGLHRATLAVKLADAQHYHTLTAEHQHNSTQFGQLMQQLRHDNTVAVIARDKHKRFGLLVPMMMSTTDFDNDNNNGPLSADDCAAYIHVGVVDDVQNFMTMNGIKDTVVEKHQSTSITAAADPTSAVGNAPQASKKKKRKRSGESGGSGTKWPVYRPDLDGFDDDGTIDWPSYKPDHGGSFDDDDEEDDYDDDGDNDNENVVDESSTALPPTATTTNMWDTSNNNNNWNSSNDDSNAHQNEANGWSQEEQQHPQHQQESSWGMNDDTDDGAANVAASLWDNSNSNSNNDGVFGDTDTTYAHEQQSGFDDYDYSGGSQNNDEDENDDDRFHKDKGAAAADEFYSNLTRDQDTTADSNLFHMRKFNNFVKSCQIKELNPNVGSAQPGKRPRKLRVLDLACGKGGDLTKWMKLDRGMRFYFGVDVARGSLRDAAIRARNFHADGNLEHAIFAVADLGADVLGQDQKLLTWKMEDDDQRYEPQFSMIQGGGINTAHRFDVVSIQFAIHYMMSTRERARHFFHTVSELLEVGGNLICTTIDARVVVGKLMGLGLDLHFDEDGNDKEPKFEKAVVETGSGACKITFEPKIVKKIITSTSTGKDLSEDMFGLEYTFTLVEGSDHAAGVGDAVNLPEWLTPIPVLEGLANEAGLVLEYAQNFHEFYNERKDVIEYQNLLRKMKALNRKGSISEDEWSISGLYAALKFRKVGESKMSTDTAVVSKSKKGTGEAKKITPPALTIEEAKKNKNFVMALLKAKRSVGKEQWEVLSKEEQDSRTIKELQKMV
jgi:SAM-dependent methyltransferase